MAPRTALPQEGWAVQSSMVQCCLGMRNKTVVILEGGVWERFRWVGVDACALILGAVQPEEVSSQNLAVSLPIANKRSSPLFFF